MTEPTTAEPREPDHPAAYALARHIADHPVSTIQAAFRYLNAPLTIELREDERAAVLPLVDRTALRARIADAIDATYTSVDSFDADRAADAVLAVLPEPAADRAAVLREAAEAAEREAARLYDDWGQKAAGGARAVAELLRRMADEAQQDGAQS